MWDGYLDLVERLKKKNQQKMKNFYENLPPHLALHHTSWPTAVVHVTCKYNYALWTIITQILPYKTHVLILASHFYDLKTFININALLLN